MPMIQRTMILCFWSATSLGALAGCTLSHPEVTLLFASPDLRQAGVACAFDSQCASHQCSADVENGGCGVCLDVQQLGQPCDGPLQGCSTSAVCEDGVCQSTKKVAGEPCALG